ncbi:MAG: trimethylamine methyltransferase family protein [Candidatus Hydrogenedentes bacterium]|nr:trimethylamine methyltransferase family protein [Candidatus Hydrogenedentota bacterium]
MDRITYEIQGGLSIEQLDEIHIAAIRVLSEVGVHVGLPELLERVSGQEGIKINDSRVLIDPIVANRFIDEHREAYGARNSQPQDFSIDILNGYGFQIFDIFTDELRPMSTEDCIQTAKIVDGLHDRHVRGGTPGLPQDVPLEWREVLAFKIGCEYSRTAGEVGITSLRAADAIYAMTEAMGRRFSLPVFVLDPLRIEGDSVEIALEFVRRGRHIRLGFSSMPLLGLTTPIYLAAAFAENIATVLGAYTLFKLIAPENEIMYRFDVYPFDMKFGTIAYGTPDHILMYLLGAQVNRYYGADALTCKPFHTNAVFPDAHAIAQRAAFATAAALAGGRRFTFGGMLGIDKIFSVEQLLYDIEIMNHVKHLVRGFDFDLSRCGFDIISGVGVNGQFATHPTTLENRDQAYYSDLFHNISPEQWSAGNKKTVKDKAREVAHDLLANYDFSLDQDIRHDLDRIFQAFKKSPL